MLLHDRVIELLKHAEFRRDMEARHGKARHPEKLFYEGEVRAYRRVLHEIANEGRNEHT